MRQQLEGPALRVRDELLRPIDTSSKRLQALSSLVGEELGGPTAPPLPHTSTPGTTTDGPPTLPTPVEPRVVPLHTLPVKKQVWILMSDPNSSRAAQLIATVVMLVIILSCVAMVVQTLPEYVNSKASAWSSLEYFCTSVFLLELGLRLWSSPDKLAFLRQPLNIVDILAILPVFLELMISSNSSSGSAIIRIVRLVRIFRVFKITRYLPWVRVFTNALLQSAQPLFMLLLIFFIAMVLFSSAIYYAEKGEWSDALGAWVRTLPSGVVEVSP